MCALVFACVCIIRQFNMSDVYTLLCMHTFILLKIVGMKSVFVCEGERERERERESSETLYLLLMGMRSSRMRYLFSEELMFAMTET